MRVIDYLVLVDIDVTTIHIHVHNEGSAAFDYGCHDHDGHDRARALHSGHDAGLRVLFTYTEHQL